MAVSKAKKSEILNELKDQFKEAKSIAFTSNNGLTVEEISNVRKQLREVNARLTLAKKTLIKIALKDVYDVEIDDAMLPGQVAVLTSTEDEVAGLSKLDKVIKDLWEEKIMFVSSYFDGSINDAVATKTIAKLPSKETLLGQLVGTMQAPIQKFVGTASAVPGGLARLLNGLKEKVEENWKEKVSDLA